MLLDFCFYLINRKSFKNNSFQLQNTTYRAEYRAQIFIKGNAIIPQQMATFNLTLDTRRARKDGTYLLVFRVRVEDKFCDIGTGWKKRSN